MSARETNSSDSQPENPVEGGVLAALPRTRPQRTSPRRVAARAQADGTKPETARAASKRLKPSAPKKTKAKPKAKPKTKPADSKAKRVSAKKAAEPLGGWAPKQGYEPEEEVELGKTVNPPSGVELVESVADIFGELANSGLAAGGRLVKDAFSLLRRP